MNEMMCCVVIAVSVVVIIGCMWFLLTQLNKKESFLMTVNGEDKSYDSMVFGMRLDILRRTISNIAPFANRCKKKDVDFLNEANAILLNYIKKLGLNSSIPKSSSFEDVVPSVKNNLNQIFTNFSSKGEIDFSFNYDRVNELLGKVYQDCFN